jgi:phage terminase large subunit
MEITLPNRWQPRPYQRRLWSYLEAGGKRAVAVWHRRAGKDEVCLHWAACAAMQRVGNYWHMLPEASQARKAIWDAINPHTGRRRIDEAFPLSIRVGQRDEDMRIKLINGSSWQIVGSDNFNSLVGSGSQGVQRQEIGGQLSCPLR